MHLINIFSISISKLLSNPNKSGRLNNTF